MEVDEPALVRRQTGACDGGVLVPTGCNATARVGVTDRAHAMAIQSARKELE